MGRRNNSSYDDVLLRKTKSIICQVLDQLNSHDEIEHAHALYSSETVDRWNQGGQPSSGADDRVRWPITFEHFVDHFDGHDQLSKNLVELLVGETIRKAVYSSVKQAEESKSVWDASPRAEEAELHWQQIWEQSQRVQREIDKVTRASRRSHTWDDLTTDSSSSSESELPYDGINFLASGSIPRAPPSVLVNRAGGGDEATTRSTRAQRSGALQRSSMLAERAANTRARRQFLQEAQQWRTSRINRSEEQARLQRQASSNNLARAARAAERASFGPLAPSQSGEDVPTDSLIHHFLTQPFPSETRASSSAPTNRHNTNHLPAVSAVEGTGSSTSTQESSINPAALELSSSRAAARATAAPRSRLGEFEAFASMRRHFHRARDDNGQRGTTSQTAEGARSVQEDETLQQALESLRQADETLRLVSQGSEEDHGADRGEALRARRFHLPALREGRPTVRLPNRTSRRDDDSNDA